MTLFKAFELSVSVTRVSKMVTLTLLRRIPGGIYLEIIIFFKLPFEGWGGLIPDVGKSWSLE